jgi:GNAT superfamily N-acetyltransferase
VTDATIRIVPARPEDSATILKLARGLATYERIPDSVTATVEDVRRCLFGERPHAEAALALAGDGAIGMVVFFGTFSTFLGRPGIYLEDIFVEEPWRGRGIGRRLMNYVARIAVERGCARLEWSVLNWNEQAIRFYKSVGAKPQDEWTVYRLAGESLRQFAAEQIT